MIPAYLIGGGGDHPERAETYGRFLEAATLRSRRKVMLIAAADTPDEVEQTLMSCRAIFAILGAQDNEVSGICLTATNPLSLRQLTLIEPTGVFVCGGSTPLYQQVLCEDLTWLDYLRERNIPYGGVSAGAAIAATNAIVGGWQAQRRGRTRSILFQGASEGLDMIDIRPGLGLVPFTVEIHASQWGTLTRLIHAIDLGLTSDAWAIDENTLIQIDTSGLTVHGPGHVYHLWRTTESSESAIQASVHIGGDLVKPVSQAK